MEDKFIKLKMTESGQWMIETNHKKMIDSSMGYLDSKIPFGYDLNAQGFFGVFVGTFVDGFDPIELIQFKQKVS